MWDPLLHAVQMVETVPVVLTLSGAAFVGLDVLALYQLLKLYAAPCATATAARGGGSAALLACGGREMYLDRQQQQMQQQELQQQSVVTRAWRKLKRFFTGAASADAAPRGRPYAGHRAAPGLVATAHPVTTTTGGQTRFAFMVLLFLAIFARAASLFCMAWIVASRPALPVVGKGAGDSSPATSVAPAGLAARDAAAVDGSNSRAAGLAEGPDTAAVAGATPVSTSPAAASAVGGQPAAAASFRASGGAAAVAAGQHPSASGAAAPRGGGRFSAAATAPSSSSLSSGRAATPPYFNFNLDAEWCLLFLDSAPALIFFASLSLIILFWAKIYYAALLVSYPKLERGHWLFSGGLLALYVLFSLFAVILQAKRSATRALQLFIALLFALAGGAFLVYGLKVARKLSERTKLSSRKSSIVKRVLFLSLACPVLFGARTLLALRGATPPLHPLLQGPSLLSQPLVTASAIFLLTEWVPAGLILAAFWHRKNRNSNVRSTQQQQLMQRQHQREQRERSFDSANVAAPLMQQPYYPFLAPPGYGDPRAGAPAAGANCDETLPGEQLGQAPVQQQQQPGVAYQPCYPLARGSPTYTLANASYPLQGYYTGQYPPHYYPPPAL